MSNLLEKLQGYKELILDDIEDIKKIAFNHSKLDLFIEEIRKKTDLDLQEYLFDLYQEHSYNLIYEIEPKDGVDFISVDSDISVSDIQLSEDDHLEQVVTKFVYKSFEEEISKFLEQLKNNQFDLIFTEVQALKIKKKVNNL
jgi:hypothetical protein